MGGSNQAGGWRAAGVVAAAVGGAVLALAGCSPRPEAVTVEGTVTQNRLTGLGEVYTLHADLRKRAPRDFVELRAFAAAIPQQFGGPTPLVPDLLVSARDRQPLVVRYNLPLKPNPKRTEVDAGGLPVPLGAEQGPVVAHEAAGVNGRRFVVYAGTNRIEEVDEARFKELVP